MLADGLVFQLRCRVHLTDKQDFQGVLIMILALRISWKAARWQEQALMDTRYRDNADMRGRLELYRNMMPYRME